MTRVEVVPAEVRNSPEETRRRILEATRALYARYGSRGTTTREVATRAGVNEATIFRHFRTKQALISEMRTFYCGISSLRNLVASLSGALDDDLFKLGVELVRGMTANEDLIRISIAEVQLDPGGGEVAWRGYLEIQALLVEYLGARVDAGEIHGTPRTLARFFSGMLFAHVIARKQHVDEALPPETIVRTCVDIFLHGVAGSGT